jgi:hypothetical protein
MRFNYAFGLLKARKYLRCKKRRYRIDGMPQIFNLQLSIFNRKVNPETVCEIRLNMLDTATIVNRKLDLNLIRFGAIDAYYISL